MISKRSLLLGAVLLVVAVVVGSDLWSSGTNCGSVARRVNTGSAIAFSQRAHSGPCGQSLSGNETRHLEIGLFFFLALITAGSISVDVRNWREAGWGE